MLWRTTRRSSDPEVDEKVLTEVADWLVGVDGVTDPVLRIGEVDHGGGVHSRLRRFDTGVSRFADLSVSLPSGAGTVGVVVSVREDSGAVVEISLEADVKAMSYPMEEVPVLGALVDLVGGGPEREPVTVEGDGVRDLVDLILSPSRDHPVLVASMPYEADPEWPAQVARLTGRVAGVAGVYVLASEAESSRMGHIMESGRLRVYGRALRCYLPGASLSRRDNPRRHRFWSGQAVDRPEASAEILSEVVRGTPPRAAEITDTLRALDRPGLGAALGVGSAGSVVAPSGRSLAVDPAVFAEVSAAVESVLGPGRKPTVDNVRALASRAVVGGEVEEESSKVTVLSRRVDRLRRVAGQYRSEIVDLRGDLDRALDEVGRYRAMVELLQASGAMVDWRAVDRARWPGSMREVLDRIGELPGVEFTGSVKTAVGLDCRADRATVSRVCWGVLLDLSDYARAVASGAFSGSLRMYLEDPSVVSVTPPGKFAAAETGVTGGREAWRGARTLPVPVEVDPAGAVYMPAHFRIGSSTGKAPRLHLHDDTGGSGVVYVGYIGPHLPSKSTN